MSFSYHAGWLQDVLEALTESNDDVFKSHAVKALLDFIWSEHVIEII